jgi:hypothetical protein
VTAAETSAPAAPAPSYDERLSVPKPFWAGLLVIVVIGIFEVGAGFTYVVIVPVALFLVGFFIVPFVITGRTRVRLEDGVLTVGGQTVPVLSISGIQCLDREQTRLRLGPQADPAARLVVKGWIGPSILLRMSNPDPHPYWLVSTRHPEQLSAAVRSARSYVRATR